jgi:polyisoprenoid-binding protein YceI
MSTLPTPGVYTVDPLHSNVDFVARHLVASKVRGHFSEFEGTITIGDSIEASSVEATVQASSITTGNEMRDGHLKSADFLELEKFPTLSLKSTKITAKGGDDYELVADLTIHGVTKSVSFDLEYLGTGPSMQEGVSVAGFEAKGEFDRRDFAINFEGALENGSLVVGNKIVVQLAVEAHQKVDATA